MRPDWVADCRQMKKAGGGGSAYATRAFLRACAGGQESEEEDGLPLRQRGSSDEDARAFCPGAALALAKAQQKQRG